VITTVRPSMGSVPFDGFPLMPVRAYGGRGAPPVDR
jgi:hypothetical protein